MTAGKYFHRFGEPFWVLLCRSLSLAKDKEIGFRQESYLTLGHDKEVSSGRNLMFKLRTNKKTTGKNISLG